MSTPVWRCTVCGHESDRSIEVRLGINWPTREEGGQGVHCSERVKRLRPEGGVAGAPMRMKWGRCGGLMEKA